MRSRTLKKVMMKNMMLSSERRPMALDQPCCAFPLPKEATINSRKPWIRIVALCAKIKRQEERLVRSFTSPVITPLSAE
ncbi:MAG: hypothetical protein BWY83_01210 [bacterium ADurb.Bin478]|nr:MAG: hypothetical protein BWY83_01210 [bacterium ADurb.Bin478]